MLLVKTKIGPSTIHGIGLFAERFVNHSDIPNMYQDFAAERKTSRKIIKQFGINTG